MTPRYCEADPFEGGKQAVAECWRNLTAVGADPMAATDNLNFGNPSGPRSWGSSRDAVHGIGEACRALGFPIVSGNVSLYNETNGRGILPTPTIGGVGLIPDWSRTARIGFAGPDRGDPVGGCARRGGARIWVNRSICATSSTARTGRRRRSISRSRRRPADLGPHPHPRRHRHGRARPA